MASGAACPTFLLVPRPPATSLPAAIILHIPCKGLAIPPFHHHSVSSLLPLLKFNLLEAVLVSGKHQDVFLHMRVVLPCSQEHQKGIIPSCSPRERGVEERSPQDWGRGTATARGWSPQRICPNIPTNTYSAVPIHNPAPQMAPAWGRSWTDSPFLRHRYFGNDISWIILVCFTSWSCEQREFLFFSLNNVTQHCVEPHTYSRREN